MEEEQGDTGGEEQDAYGGYRREHGRGAGAGGDGQVRQGLQRGAAEPVQGNCEYREHDGAEAIQRSAQRRADAERGVREREREHDGECRSAEPDTCEQAAPPAGAAIPEEDAELRRRRSRQHVHEREALHELRLGEPLPPFLELRLHDPLDCGASIRGRANLEKRRKNLTHRPPPAVFTSPAREGPLILPSP
jgi:hypothetical protein